MQAASWQPCCWTHPMSAAYACCAAADAVETQVCWQALFVPHALWQLRIPAHVVARGEAPVQAEYWIMQ